jgi:hypothetical protein
VPTGWTLLRINIKRVSDAKKPLFYVMQLIMLGDALLWFAYSRVVLAITAIFDRTMLAD